MAIRPILYYPDPRLFLMARPVTNVNEDIRKLVDDMAETMYAAPGIGLAAPQLNELKRIIMIDISEHRNNPQVFINPEIIEKEGEQRLEEGCLSVPGIFECVDRAAHVRVRALDRQGAPFTTAASELLAVCLQHEIDHLDGKVFVNYLSRLKQQRIRKKLEKQSRVAM
ncbi:MAG TPA: peptide deformylase [Acidiferrobacteraceae bacterium]|nr:peptide deformylase [Acidiferrobacteraceae bacterium]HEX20169.1 peptide deformylase [Acidiferrobacteraceae bacterium]